MSKRLKMLPAFLMLSAGAVTSIITYMLHYEGKTALTILLGVLLLFYVLGKLFQNMIFRFEQQNAEEERKKKKEEEEGTVVEKDADGNPIPKKDSEEEQNGVKDAGEQ